jgi:hypothetical protein
LGRQLPLAALFLVARVALSPFLARAPCWTPFAGHHGVP